MKIVLDTNVLLVSISPTSRDYWVFKKFIDEEYTLCVTTDILDEYAEIIEKHTDVETANFALTIIKNAVNVEYITKYFYWNFIYADPDDDKFVDCAIACNATYIVSHDKHFNVLKDIAFPKVNVIDIHQFKTVLEDKS